MTTSLAVRAGGLGLALGEAAAQFSGADARQRKRLWWISALANNVPDLDVLLRAGHGHKLDYLLQHRGFTHTFVCVVPQALLLWAIFWLVGRRHWKRGEYDVLNTNKNMVGTIQENTINNYSKNNGQTGGQRLIGSTGGPSISTPPTTVIGTDTTEGGTTNGTNGQEY
jgi:hypothetical protein